MLARSPDLSVIARNSSFTYKGTPIDVRKIGSDLQVKFVLEGSVRKDADKIRIVAQLVNALSGEHVWAERFDETGDDPFLIQDAMTEKIVTAIAGDTGEIRRSLREEAWHKDAASLAEYDYYLRGHSLFFRNTSKDMAEAIRIWSEGLSRFPESALLKFKLGFAYYISLISGWSHDTEGDMLRIRSFARDGLAKANLTPLEIKLGHWLMAYVHLLDRDFKASLREAEAAIQKAPNDAYMLPAIGDAAVSNKEYDKAISWLDFGIRNDPVNTSLYAAWKGWALTSAERYKESAELMKDVPDFYEQVPLTRALNAVRLGDLDEAKKQVKKALELNPNGGVKYFRPPPLFPRTYWNDKSWTSRRLDFRTVRRAKNDTGWPVSQGSKRLPSGMLSSCRYQRPINTPLANPELLGNRRPGDALRVHGTDRARWFMAVGFSALVLPIGLGLLDARALTLQHHGPLKLGRPRPSQVPTLARGETSSARHQRPLGELRHGRPGASRRLHDRRP